MFSGTFRPRLDDKNRLILPAKFREAMGDGLVITRGQERSIDVRTSADFATFTERFKNASQTDVVKRYGIRKVGYNGKIWDAGNTSQSTFRS